MSKKYLYDEYGNKYEGLTKEEIVETFGAGGLREDVLTGSIMYNSNEVRYNYSGNKPDDAILLKLLGFGCNPTTNNLTTNEIQSYLGLNEFSINFFCVDTELYVTNANKSYLSFVKVGVGEHKLYPNGSKKLGFYMKANEQMNNVQVCTTEEFNSIAKSSDTFYIVNDENYKVEEAEHADTADEATGIPLNGTIGGGKVSHIFEHDGNTVSGGGNIVRKARMAEQDANGEIITETYKRIDEEIFQEIDTGGSAANLLYDYTLPNQNDIELTLLEGKSWTNTIGIGGTVQMLINGEWHKVNFNGLWHDRAYPRTECMAIIPSGNYCYVVKFAIGIKFRVTDNKHYLFIDSDSVYCYELTSYKTSKEIEQIYSEYIYVYY